MLKSESAHKGTPEEKERYINYYGWIGYALVFQAALFCISHWIWKRVEKGTLKTILPRNLETEDANSQIFTCRTSLTVLNIASLKASMLFSKKSNDIDPMANVSPMKKVSSHGIFF